MRLLWFVAFFVLPVAGLRGSVLFDQLKEEYSRKGGVELAAGTESFPVTLAKGVVAGKNVPKSDIDIYLYLFRKEFGKYPAELITLTGLKRVVFCRELSLNGQPRAALPDGENNTLYLDVRSGIYSETYRRKVIHHGFYRLLDLASHDGTGDADWVALNAPDFHYGSAGAVAEGDNKSSLVSHPAPGFLNSWSMSAVEADKAEIFANLMVNDLKTRLLVKQDEILRAKVQRLKDMLALFCRPCGEAFWANVAKQF